MKKCTKCKKEKSLREFRKSSRSKDGRQWQCRSCAKDRDRSDYKNSPKRRAQVRDSNDRRKLRNRELVVEYLRLHPCVDCGEEDIVVLDFDHMTDKKYDISFLMCCGYGEKKLMEEISKCVIRCANCHRRKTARENGWFKCRDSPVG